MLNLIKYECIRRYKLILAAIAILIFAELGAILGLYKGAGWITLAVFLIFFISIGAILFVFVDAIRSYSSDLNSKQGYSLFLTPSSGYKIIGSKSIFNFILLLSFVGIVIGFLFLDYKVANYLYFDKVSLGIKEMIDAMKTQLTLPSVLQISLLFLVTTVSEWFTIIMLALMAMTIRKTLLSNVQYGWLISLIFFIVFYSATQLITLTILAPFGFYGEIFDVAKNPEAFKMDVFRYIGIVACIYPVYIAIFYYISGRLLNKRVDL